jgi:hypothetical protein
MAAYAVYEEKDARRLPLTERAEALTFVKDGFSWSAFALSGPWLAFKGHWRALAVWVAALVVLGGLFAILGLGPLAYGSAWLALALVVGFEASALERDHLERKERREVGYVTGGSRADCEQTALARLADRIEGERQHSELADA